MRRSLFPLLSAISALLLSAALAPPALAQVACTAPDGGKLLASGCFQCHGTDGNNGAFDALAGDGQADMFNKLKDMKTKKVGANIMYPHAWGYTDAQLSCITLYFSKLKKP